MKNVLSLVKASLSQDMNFFNYSVKRNSGKFKKIIFPLILFILVAFSIGSYAFMMAKALHKVNLTYIVLTLFLFLVVILNFIQGIYKSQGILFEAKDNDLLFSLPIDKSYILFVRIFKLMLFQFLYNLMFLVPAIFCYCYFEIPSLGFYFLTLLIMLLIPIIPTILSSFLGYVVKLVSSRFKSKKIIQTILSFFIFFGIYLLTMKMDTFVSQLASTASNLNEIISYTTRPIREGEQEGINYHYVSNEEFSQLVLENKMLEATVFNSWGYGTAINSLNENKINIFCSWNYI